MTTKGRSGQTDKTMWKTEQKVKTYVEKFHMIEPGDTIVLGIFGVPAEDPFKVERIMGNFAEGGSCTSSAAGKGGR